MPSTQPPDLKLVLERAPSGPAHPSALGVPLMMTVPHRNVVPYDRKEMIVGTWRQRGARDLRPSCMPCPLGYLRNLVR